MQQLLDDRDRKGNAAASGRTWFLLALALFATVGAAGPAWDSGESEVQDKALLALGGEWLYVEDLTEGRAVEEQGPPMNVTFGLRIEKDAVVVLWGKGEGRREERYALDGSVTEVAKETSIMRYSGTWKGGAFKSQSEIVRVADGSLIALIQREFRATPEGLLARVLVDPPDGMDSLARYRHPEDIPLPTPARAKIDDMEWLADAWVGTLGTSSIEERWGPPLGGAMLGVSRTVSRGAMRGFEYLRIVERDGGLVYVAQPGGSPPTEFVLTELEGTRAVFENPRHDSPQRIVYEFTPEDSLMASIGFIHGGRPMRFEFRREGL